MEEFQFEEPDVDSGYDLTRRYIYIFGEVDEEMARRFCAIMDLMEGLSNRPITIWMSSLGGNEDSGYSMTNRLLDSTCHVTIRVIGECCSIAAAVLQGADHRVMYPNTFFMIHSGWQGSESIKKQDEEERQREAHQLRKNNQRYYNVLGRSGATIEKITEWVKKETYFSPEEALEAGFIDEVFKPLKEFKPKPKRGRKKKEK